MNEQVPPFDPLDPQQRIRRGRERTEFFRQTNVFPIVVLTMVIFVPLALWYQSLALPFLGWMAAMPPMISGLDRAWANWSGKTAKLGNSNLRAACVSIVLFAAIGFPFSGLGLLIAAGLVVVVYGFALLNGMILPQGDEE